MSTQSEEYQQSIKKSQKNKGDDSKKKSKECCQPKKKKCPEFPLTTTALVQSPVVPIFGSTTTSVTVPLTTTITSTTLPATTVTIGGTCDDPTYTLTLGAVNAAGVIITATFTISCNAGFIVFGVPPATPPTPITPAPLLTFSGLPIVGAIPGSFTSCPDPTVDNVIIKSNECKALLLGRISQLLSFSGVAATLSAATLLDIATLLLTDLFAPLAACAGAGATLDVILLALTGTGTIGAALSTQIGLVLTALGISAIATTSAFLTNTLIPALAPALAAQLATSLSASSVVPTVITVPPFPFSLILSDPSIGSIDPCEDALCAEVKAKFISATGSALTPVPTTSTFTLALSSTCSLIPGNTKFAPALTPINVINSTFPSIPTSTLPITLPSLLISPTLGGTIVTPAVIITDNLLVLIDHGDACFCPPRVIGNLNAVDLFTSSSSSSPSFINGLISGGTNSGLLNIFARQEKCCDKKKKKY
jgi:hypothetical protein